MTIPVPCVGVHDRRQFPIEAPTDQCHLMDGATGTCSKDNGTFLNLRRATTPPAICFNVNSRRLDNPPQLSVLPDCRRWSRPLWLRYHNDDNTVLGIEATL